MTPLILTGVMSPESRLKDGRAALVQARFFILAVFDRTEALSGFRDYQRDDLFRAEIFQLMGRFAHSGAGGEDVIYQDYIFTFDQFRFCHPECPDYIILPRAPIF